MCGPSSTCCPYRRQEEGEDSPEGYPQDPPTSWCRRHDEYDT